VWSVHINYVGKVYCLLVFCHSREELGSYVQRLSIMMSEIWGISLSFCLLVGFGADVYGCVELECNKMSLAHYVSRLVEECFRHRIRKIVKSAWVKRMLLMVFFEFFFYLFCCT
jgi:hypothetical protein